MSYARGGFEVTGLPDGIAFKKPTGYGLKQIQEIMKNAEKIKFKIIEEKEEYSRVLHKIIDEDKIAACLSKHALVTEQDMEVSDLDLLTSEYHILVTDLKDHFEKDAMTSLIANYQCCLTHKGYVLPVYTDTSEPYWLFYYPGTSSEIEGFIPEDKIRGYWLNKSSDLEYKVLASKTSITALNVVCLNGELGTLRLKRNISIQEGSTISIPIEFNSSVLTCLEEQGFL